MCEILWKANHRHHTSNKVESLPLNTGSLHFLVSVLQVAQLCIVCNVKGCQFLVATKGHNGKLHVCVDLDNVWLLLLGELNTFFWFWKLKVKHAVVCENQQASV